jgi:hypothetical protein
MIVVRFKVQCQPDRADEVAAAMKLFESGALVSEPEYTIYDVSSFESPG